MSLAYNKNLNGARNGGIYLNYSGGPKNNIEFDFMSVTDRMEKPNKLYGELKMMNVSLDIKKPKNMTKKYYNKLSTQKKK